MTGQGRELARQGERGESREGGAEYAIFRLLKKSKKEFDKWRESGILRYDLLQRHL